MPVSDAHGWYWTGGSSLSSANAWPSSMTIGEILSGRSLIIPLTMTGWASAYLRGRARGLWCWSCGNAPYIVLLQPEQANGLFAVLPVVPVVVSKRIYGEGSPVLIPVPMPVVCQCRCQWCFPNRKVPQWLSHLARSNTSINSVQCRFDSDPVRSSTHTRSFQHAMGWGGMGQGLHKNAERR